MTATQDTRSIGQLLVEKRNGGYKAVAARAIGVSRQIYDTWESGHFIPGDEWANPIAVYLERSLEEIAGRLFNDRARKRGMDAPIIHAVSGLRRPKDTRPNNRSLIAWAA